MSVSVAMLYICLISWSVLCKSDQEKQDEDRKRRVYLSRTCVPCNTAGCRGKLNACNAMQKMEGSMEYGFEFYLYFFPRELEWVGGRHNDKYRRIISVVATCPP